MPIEIDNKAFLAEMKKKIEKQLLDKEIGVIEYWKQELEKIYQKRPENLGALQVELKNLTTRMENRIRILKQGN